MGMFREINEGKENFDSQASKLLSQEGTKLGEASIKANDKVEQKFDVVADASQAENAKSFGKSSTNFRETLNGQAPASQETVLGQVGSNMITAEDVAYLEEKFGRRLDTLRVMSTFSNVSENPVKAMSDLNRIINDVQKS